MVTLHIDDGMVGEGDWDERALAWNLFTGMNGEGGACISMWAGLCVCVHVMTNLTSPADYKTNAIWPKSDIIIVYR